MAYENLNKESRIEYLLKIGLVGYAERAKWLIGVMND